MSTIPSIGQIRNGLKPGACILFANFPADGHFNPLTGLAAHLKSLGYDVRWYTSSTYAPRIAKLGIPHYPLKRALDITGENLEALFPARDKIRSQVRKLNFDIINVFILRGPEYFEDIQEIHSEWPFDLMIADVIFTAIPMVKEVMRIPVISVGVVPLTETSRDLGPVGLGLTPDYSLLGKIRQSALRFFADKVLFAKPFAVLKQTLGRYGLKPEGNLFNTIVRKSTLLLQSGTPGFEYERSDLGANVRFIGPLLPQGIHQGEKWFHEKLMQFSSSILVTQGTVERDVEKIIVPTLEAFKDTDKLVIVTTGGSQTEALRRRYPQANILIEDFIPFNDVLPYVDVYVTNGGYGGVMLGIQNRVPMVVAGQHEGKNEICARIGYFRLGINLKTEKPKPSQVKAAVEKVLSDKMYNRNAELLAREFRRYDPKGLTAHYVAEVLKESARAHKVIMREEEEIY